MKKQTVVLAVIATLANDRTPLEQRRAVYTLQGGDDGIYPNDDAYRGIDDLTQ